MLFRVLHEDAVIPAYQTSGSSGMDLASIEELEIGAGERAVVKTGLGLDLSEHDFKMYTKPFTIEAQIRPRSGLAAKHGITVLNTPGTIDSDYKGELMVILYNTSKVPFKISKGDRIAQLVLAPVLLMEAYVTNNERNDGGFGSTGV